MALVRGDLAARDVEDRGMSEYLAPGHAPLKFHPLANLFPMLSDPELDDLGTDIAQNGQVETVKLHRGLVLDGRNRYTACLKKNIGVRYEVFSGSDREALAWVISKNLKRRHLSEGQRAAVAAAIGRLPLGANQHTAPAQICAPSLDLGDKPTEPVESQPAMSQVERADLLNVSRRSVQDADLVFEKGAPELQEAMRDGRVAASTAADIAEAMPIAEQQQIVHMDKKQILEAAKVIRKEQNDKRRGERTDEIKRLSDASTSLPTGRKFPLIYMDPPTKFAAGDSDRSTENHYPTMNEEEIAALPVNELALDKAVLLIWTTVPWLHKTLRLIEGWGFEYKSCACWDKETIGLGFWWQNQHEILIAATRGNPVIPENGSIMGPSLYREKKTRHSAKPEYFRAMIDSVPEWKDWPKVELFSRVEGEMPDGWKAWGNEARVKKQQTLGIDSGEEAA
jgi:N6-adenosine-specific RNA methylase IME4